MNGFYVYMLLSIKNDKHVSYVGYTIDLKKRLSLHNSSKGAKFTKGKIWKLIYFKKFKTKSIALKNEYLLKKDKKKRNAIKSKYIMN